MNFITGYKTYIVAAVLLLIGALSFLGITIPGFEGDPGLTISTAIGLIFGRVGARTEVRKLADANDLEKPK